MMDRRNFLKGSFGKVVGGVINSAETAARKKAKHWIRPPFAREELDFLLTCTRCDACMEACPHNIIFPLPLSRGVEFAQTPALDLINHGCHLCEGWPCVLACEPDALVFSPASIDAAPEADTENQLPVSPPLLAIAEINTNQCLPYLGPECGACRESCPVPDALIFSDEKPTINADLCVGCGLCREACIADPRAVDIRSLNI
ncbi:MAG TPA: hypothetical protein EYG51_19570 [Pseudomonadales bacterium]|nr:hypothetical protein [Pseudomonadales bacterium]